jgi:hypothetical protein
LAEGEKPHSANYQGGRHANEELQKKKSQRTPKTTTGWAFSNLTIAAALRCSTAQQQPQARQVPVAVPLAGVKLSTS